MSCNSCHKNPCCCEKIISVRGPKGERGERGVVGPAGPAGIQGPAGPSGTSNAFITTLPNEIQYFPSAYVTFLTFTVTVAGNYLINYEGDVNLFIQSPSSVIYEIRKNGTIITNSDREISPYVPEAGNYTHKTSSSTGVLSLAVGDVITVDFQSANRFYIRKRSLTLLKIDNLTIL